MSEKKDLLNNLKIDRDVINLMMNKLYEIDFKDKEEFDAYNKKHKMRKTTKVNIAGKDTTVGDVEGGKQTTAGDAEAVKEFLAAGTEVNAKTEDGWTPLHSAAMNGYKEIAELLIAKGADVNAKNKRGDTSLNWAISRKHTEIADLLRKHGGKTGNELKAEGK